MQLPVLRCVCAWVCVGVFVCMMSFCFGVLVSLFLLLNITIRSSPAYSTKIKTILRVARSSTSISSY
jgi:hypothetical protein